MEAQEWTSVMIAFASWEACDRPTSPQRGALLHEEHSAAQKDVVRRWLSEARRFGSASGGEIPTGGRGRGRLEMMLATTKYNDVAAAWGTPSSMAAEVIPDLVSLQLPTTSVA